MSNTLNVYSAINAVQEDLSKQGITKNNTNKLQGYKFRGIDDVLNVLSGLLSKHKLVILPRVLNRICDVRQSKNGGDISYVVVDVEFDLISTMDGTKHTVKVFGEAMDSSDKATNKAMSAAYKYMAILSFAIPTEGDNDADASTHLLKQNPTPQAKNDKPKVEVVLTEEEQATFNAICAGLSSVNSAVALKKEYFNIQSEYKHNTKLMSKINEFTHQLKNQFNN